MSVQAGAKSERFKFRMIGLPGLAASCKTVAPLPSSGATHRNSKAPATAMQSVVATYRRVMRPKSTADALCRRAWRPPCSPLGRLASPCARLPPLVIKRDCSCISSTSARNRENPLANRFERQIVRRLEMNATLPHIELRRMAPICRVHKKDRIRRLEHVTRSERLWSARDSGKQRLTRQGGVSWPLPLFN